jgi:hypothetical protein
MNQKQERVLFETGRHRITGTVTLAREGYRSRISDLLNATERSFISLTDVVVESLDGVTPDSKHGYLALARDHVVFAVTLPEA